jgi:hypothetical protein
MKLAALVEPLSFREKPLVGDLQRVAVVLDHAVFLDAWMLL